MTINSIGQGLGAQNSGFAGAFDTRGSQPFPLNQSTGAQAPLGARRSGHDTPELKKAFSDFVGQTFYGEMMKQMRASLDKPAFFHGGMGEDVFQSQLDQVMVERISDASASKISEPMYHLLMAPRS